MARILEEPKIRSIKFTYGGTENSVNNFLVAIVKDYLIKNNMIDQRIAVAAKVTA